MRALPLGAMRERSRLRRRKSVVLLAREIIKTLIQNTILARAGDPEKGKSIVFAGER